VAVVVSSSVDGHQASERKQCFLIALVGLVPLACNYCIEVLMLLKNKRSFENGVV